MSDEARETATLGQFDPLEAPIVLDLMEENCIFAFSKTPLDQTESRPYGNVVGMTGRGQILVDASKLDEARRLIDEELPKIVEEMRKGLEETDVGEVPEGEV